MRLALNSILDEWKVFVQSILGSEAFPNWDEMWAALVKLDRSISSSGPNPKLEEEDKVTLASKGQ